MEIERQPAYHPSRPRAVEVTMQRRTFLTITAFVPMAVGALALLAPGFLLGELKGAETNGAAEVMARTVGVLLVSWGVLTFLVRGAPGSSTLRAVLAGNLFLQLAMLPVDPLAYMSGVFVGLGSFVPNTILHVVLAAAFVHFLRRTKDGDLAA
jgi:hypothetical protein